MGTQQEIAHRFGSFLTSSFGNPFGLLGRAQAHWGVFFDADFSPMDGNDWVDNGNGTFTLNQSYLDEAALKRSKQAMPYNDLDLYTMGLLDPAQAKPMFVIENPTTLDGRAIRPFVNDPQNPQDAGPDVEIQNPDGTWSGPTLLFTSQVIQGQRRDLTLQDIINLEGPRNPSFPTTQKDFSTALITLTNDEEKALDQLEITRKLANFRDGFLNFFREMARNGGTLFLPPSEALTSGPLGLTASLVSPSSSPTFLPPLYSHSGNERIDPRNLDPASLEAFFKALLPQEENLWEAFLEKGFSESLASPIHSFAQFLRNPLSQDLRDLFSLASSPTAFLSELLRHSFDPTSLTRPLPYSEWKKIQGIQETNPFAQDPLLTSPLPLLVNPEMLPLNNVILRPPPALRAEGPGGEAEESQSEILPLRFAQGQDDNRSIQDPSTSPPPSSPPSPIPHSEFHIPQFPHTPLIWDALDQGKEEEENEKGEENRYTPKKKRERAKVSLEDNLMESLLTRLSGSRTHPSQVYYSLIDWWREITSPWRVQDHTYCSERYRFCVTNHPQWAVDVPTRNPFGPPEPLIVFALLTSDAEGLPDIDAEISITPPESLSGGVYKVESPTDYLLMSLSKLKDEVAEFHLIGEPQQTFIQGRKAARARFSLKDEDGLLLEAEAYAFLFKKNKGLAIIYRAKKDKFEQYRISAMRIIESFTIEAKPSGK